MKWAALALAVLLTPTSALAWEQDLNCNGIPEEEEERVDLDDPLCSPYYPSADWYVNYTDFGCLYFLDRDEYDPDWDGLGAGYVLVLEPDSSAEQLVVLLCDNCPDDYNPEQEDGDEDQVGDVCDNCPEEANHDQADRDEDGVGDACDICRYDYDPEQEDSDGDGIGDACDDCPELPNIDENGDGIPDSCPAEITWRGGGHAPCQDCRAEGGGQVAGLGLLVLALRRRRYGQTSGISDSVP